MNPNDAIIVRLPSRQESSFLMSSYVRVHCVCLGWNFSIEVQSFGSSGLPAPLSSSSLPPSRINLANFLPAWNRRAYHSDEHWSFCYTFQHLKKFCYRPSSQRQTKKYPYFRWGAIFKFEFRSMEEACTILIRKKSDGLEFSAFKLYILKSLGLLALLVLQRVK